MLLLDQVIEQTSIGSW